MRNIMFTVASVVVLAAMTDAIQISPRGGRSTSPLAEVSSTANAERNGGRSTNPMAEVQSTSSASADIAASTQASAGAKAQARGQANAQHTPNVMSWFKEIKNPEILDANPAQCNLQHGYMY